MERGIKVLLFARVDARKMVPSRSLAAGTFVRQFVSGIQQKGSPTIVQLLHLLCLLIRSLQNGTVPFDDIHEVPRSVPHDQPRVDDQRLAQYSSQIASVRIRESCNLLHASKESQP